METQLLFLSIILILWLCQTVNSSKPVVITKVNKCCPLRHVYNEKTNRCEERADSSNSTQWNLNKTFVDDGNTSLFLEWQAYGFPDCPYNKLVTLNRSNKGSSSEVSYYVSNDGNLLELSYVNDDDFTVNHLPKHYCIDPYTTGIVIRICPPTCDEREPCIRKCCSVGQHYRYEKGQYKCEKSNNTSYQLPLYPHASHSSNKTTTSQPRFTSGYNSVYWCQNGTALTMSTGWKFASVKKPFKVLSNGDIVYYHGKGHNWAMLNKPQDYCYDRLHYQDPKSQLCKKDVDILYFCTPNSMTTVDKNSLKWLKQLAYVTLIIAIVSLLLTSIILFLLIDRVNLHSWTRLSFVTSEFVFLFLFSLIYAKESLQPQTSPIACKMFAAVFHYTGLVTMCWLSIINFDLWWTFKVLKPTSNRKFDIRRFIYYMCFALGLPLLIVSVALIIQNSKPPKISKKQLCRDEADEIIALAKSQWISPGYGETSCTLSTGSLLPYWYGPLCFLLLANLVFFFTTTCRMVSLRRMTRRASIENTSGHSQTNKIFLKIFIVSGVTWNIELIGWLLKVDPKYRLDIVHHFQAMALFYIFVCKKGVIRSLQNKYPIIMKVLPPIGRSQRSATLASVSTDASSRIRVGRKLSTASTNSSSVVGESYQRHESFELPATSPTAFTAPVFA
ncbi:unnamed protein product [Allacma fusca]|uniref:G-protein coupled receptors family 2 profile 2 domain-containing protein n=1 Tax=Allacma fusca TaxID=39272 RepID=A0A8J2JHG4_9HEXA|nr:unnamed protein product [Allacma fusca]